MAAGKTVTYRGSTGRERGSSSFQTEGEDGTTYLFQQDRPVQEVPEAVVKSLEAATGHKFDIEAASAGSKGGNS